MKPIIVGTSGGADSMVLAWTLHHLGFPVVLAHLNHGLRGKESDADEKRVAAFAKQLKVSFEVRRVNLKKVPGNLEEAGRRARYAFFEALRVQYGADFIAVAHHLDDHLETVLMHLMRGAGLRGLSGLKLLQGRVIRPLLGLTKKEILRLAKRHSIPYHEDSSNRDLHFTRNRLRHLVLPHLNTRSQKQLLTLAQDAQNQLKRLEKRAQLWIQGHVKQDAFLISSFLKTSASLKGEILVQMLGAQDLYSKDIVRLSDFIRFGKNGQYCELKNKIFSHCGAFVCVLSAMPRTKTWGPISLHAPSKVKIAVRSWKPGDRFEPVGMKGSKKLQDFFVDHKIPAWLRGQIPIFVDDQDRILSVGNLRKSRLI